MRYCFNKFVQGVIFLEPHLFYAKRTLFETGGIKFQFWQILFSRFNCCGWYSNMMKSPAPALKCLRQFVVGSFCYLHNCLVDFILRIIEIIPAGNRIIPLTKVMEFMILLSRINPRKAITESIAEIT